MKCALLTTDFVIPDLLSTLSRAEKVNQDFDTYVVINELGVSLLMPEFSKIPYQVNFESNQMRYRSAQLAHQNELIIKACRIKSLARPVTIVDATAGFGRDAFILAAAGFELFLVERNPIVAALLIDGIRRISDPMIKQRLRCIHQDSREYLSQAAHAINKPDVIYLDPMFTVHRHAKVKKELQILQTLLQDESADQQTLLPVALQVGAQRVVVKRAIHAEALNLMNPSYCLSGKHSRFDVYVRH
jgi:16S rRNA (guanine1516-N2)-methyltransferase